MVFGQIHGHAAIGHVRLAIGLADGTACNQMTADLLFHLMQKYIITLNCVMNLGYPASKQNGHRFLRGYNAGGRHS